MPNCCCCCCCTVSGVRGSGWWRTLAFGDLSFFLTTWRGRGGCCNSFTGRGVLDTCRASAITRWIWSGRSLVGEVEGAFGGTPSPPPRPSGTGETDADTVRPLGVGVRGALGGNADSGQASRSVRRAASPRWIAVCSLNMAPLCKSRTTFSARVC